MTLKLGRSLAVIDLETTGTDPETARIVSIGILMLFDGPGEHREEMLLNPGIPIPPEAFAVHGITDAMVAQAPTFEDVAAALLDDLEDCDLAGFNIAKYDLPVLQNEFMRAGIIGFGEGKKIVDVMQIYHRNEKRDLAGAVRFYLGRNHEMAHNALSDAAATAEILLEQVKRYGLPEDVAGLDAYCREKPAEYVDADGRLLWRGDEAVFGFGKVKGQTLREAAAASPDYLRWIMGADFSPEIKSIVRDALSGTFPARAQA